MIKLLFFASLRETLNIGEEQIERPTDITNVTALTSHLQQRGTVWRKALADKRLTIAVNQAVARPDTRIQDGDEIAWFPPVTGG